MWMRRGAIERAAWANTRSPDSDFAPRSAAPTGGDGHRRAAPGVRARRCVVSCWSLLGLLYCCVVVVVVGTCYAVCRVCIFTLCNVVFLPSRCFSSLSLSLSLHEVSVSARVRSIHSLARVPHVACIFSIRKGCGRCIPLSLSSVWGIGERGTIGFRRRVVIGGMRVTVVSLAAVQCILSVDLYLYDKIGRCDALTL